MPVHANVWLDQGWRRGGGPYDHSTSMRHMFPPPGLPRVLVKIAKAALVAGPAPRGNHASTTGPRRASRMGI